MNVKGQKSNLTINYKKSYLESMKLGDINQRRIILHILFWIGYLILLTSVYANAGNFGSIIARNLITVTFQAILVYFNFWILIPRYFQQNRPISYYGLLMLAIAVITPIRVYVDNWLITDTDSIGLEFYTLPHIANVVLSSVTILFISSSFKYRQLRLKNEQVQQELKSYRLEAELRFLQTQVNPHFLFNVLNNIYTLAYTNSKEAAPMVMKLSEMMRYMLYTSNAEKVSLKKEINYLENYIALQQMKKSQKQKISFESIGVSNDLFIEPMLFIPFFENSFKHGNIDNTEEGWLDSSLKANQYKIDFYIANSISRNAKKKDKVGGIGLENIQQRLQLLYPNQHTLTIEEEVDTYTVNLKLQLR